MRANNRDFIAMQKRNEPLLMNNDCLAVTDPIKKSE